MRWPNAMVHFVGSGISPRAAFVCDPSSAFCVLDGESVPALR